MLFFDNLSQFNELSSLNRYKELLSQKDRSMKKIDLSTRVPSKYLKSCAHVPFSLANPIEEHDRFYQRFSPRTKHLVYEITFRTNLKKQPKYEYSFCFCTSLSFP